MNSAWCTAVYPFKEKCLSSDEHALAVSELLLPIDPARPSGADLRYDPLFDRIAEARIEEDASLPAGEWERPAKKADFALIASLAQDALLHRSKDLWLAVWFGEARIHLDGFGAIRPALTLLLSLQQVFWTDLYPQLEEADDALRAAPIQWALQHFAILLSTIPTLTTKHNFLDYKRTRDPKNADEIEFAQALNALIEQTEKTHYIALEQELAHLSKTVEKLHSFCEERYGADGPSCTRMRAMVAEIQNTASSLLREKRRLEPDSDPPAPQGPLDDASSDFEARVILDRAHLPGLNEYLAESSNAMSIDVNDASPYLGASGEVADSSVILPVGVNSIGSSAEARGLIRRAASYLVRAEPGDETAYLVFSSLVRIGHKDTSNGLLQHPPSRLLRTALHATMQGARQHGTWAQLLKCSLEALALRGSANWLDLHHYIFLSSEALEHKALSLCVLDVVRSAWYRNPAWDQDFFDDYTPTANEATRAWLADLDSISEASRLLLRTATFSALPIKQLFTEKDNSALHGDLVASVHRIMNDAAGSNAHRRNFQSRLHVARLCLTSNQPEVALRLLQQMLSECDTHQLVLWEGPDLVAEVIRLLLQSLKASPQSEEHALLDTKALLSRLFELDPARALALVVQTQGEGGA